MSVRCVPRNVYFVIVDEKPRHIFLCSLVRREESLAQRKKKQKEKESNEAEQGNGEWSRRGEYIEKTKKESRILACSQEEATVYNMFC